MIAFLIKLALTVALVALIAAKIDLGTLQDRFAALSPLAIAAALAITAAQMCLLTARWNMLCEFMGYRLRFRKALTCMLISQFFSQGLPASVGGDAIRIWLLSRMGVEFGRAAHNVMLDRLAGLVSLLALNVPACLLLAALAPAASPVIALAALTAFAILFLVLLASRVGRLLCIYAVLFARNFAGSAFGRFMRGAAAWIHGFQRLVGRFHLSGARLAVILGVGVMIHLMSILICWVVAVDAGIGLTLTGGFAVVPAVLLFSYLPLSIGGWGVREGSMVVGLGLIGVPASDAVFIGLALGTSALIVALVGGTAWLASPMPRESRLG